MRDPNRIDKFCNELAKLWHKFPDWRFGQFVLNMERACRVNTGRDVFFLEDEEFFKFMRDFLNEVTGNKDDDK